MRHTLVGVLRSATLVLALCGGLVRCVDPGVPALEPSSALRSPAVSRAQPVANGQSASSGCSDGTRDGFDDPDRYPGIAACAGAWTEPGLAERAATQGSSASALCAKGWHVCATSAEVAERTKERGCADAVRSEAPMFFATLESGPGNAHCEGEGENDIFGCGTLGATPAKDCGVLNRFSHNNCSALASPWTCSGDTTEVSTVTKTGSEGGGVLCCR